MERLRHTVHEFNELNADVNPDEGLRDVTTIVEEVRRERHQRVQQAGAGCR